MVSFTQMADGTRSDYELLDGFERTHARGLADRLLDTLDGLSCSLGGYQITRLEHSLQSATRARLDGADVDWVVAALLHDIGDDLAPYNHSEFAAAVLRPYVRSEVTWTIEQHGVFQSYYYAHHFDQDRHGRDAFAEHRWASLCAQFCESWDQNSFDPGFANHTLDSFVDDVHEVFAREPHDAAVVAPGPASLTT